MAPKSEQQKAKRKELKKVNRQIKQLEDSLHKKESYNEKLQKRIEQLEEENKKLKQELKSLRKPPAWVKANVAKEGNKRRKKLGPKKGHSPHSWKVPEEIDHECEITPKACPDCNSLLPGSHKHHTHVQVELPKPRPVVTRYLVGWCWCSNCKKEVSVREKFPRSKYGPNLHAQVCYWKYGLGLTLPKISKLLRDQYELELSTGQLAGMIKKTGESLRPVYEDLNVEILSHPYLHADETGWRIDGQNSWLWSFSNEAASYYRINRSRGSKVVEDILGKSYTGVLCSDFYAGYNKIKSEKQRCWTHLLRECRELKNKYPDNDEIKIFTSRIKSFFKRGKRLQESFISGININRSLKRLETDIDIFISGKWKDSDLRRLCKRMFKFRKELLTFIKAGIDPTNNHAEREIRPAVLMRKTSYGNRSKQGAETQAILMSMIRTAEKQGQCFSQMASDRLVNH